MFSKKEISQSMSNYSNQVDKLRSAIEVAEVVVIGAGAGLSSSAGLTYTGERFQKNFSEFIAKYHYRDMYSATFYPYKSLEEYWGYMSHHIFMNRYAEPAGKLYQALMALMEGKNSFVITTNVDHCFQKAGQDKHRLYYTQGDYGLWQCSVPCHEKTYDNKDAVMEMLKEQKDLRIPTELIPHCPKCGAPMSMNLRCDNTFVQDDGWYAAAHRYQDFIKKFKDAKVLYLELGVGGNTPSIIKYPFWRLVSKNPAATYACINLYDAIAPKEIVKQSICIQADIGDVMGSLCNTSG